MLQLHCEVNISSQYRRVITLNLSHACPSVSVAPCLNPNSSLYVLIIVVIGSNRLRNNCTNSAQVVIVLRGRAFSHASAYPSKVNGIINSLIAFDRKSM